MGFKRTVQEAWKTQLSEWLRLAILAAIPSVGAAYSYAKGYPLTAPVLVGAGVFVMVMFAVVLMRAFRFYRQAAITVDNIEAKVQEWADTFRFSIQRLDLPNQHFTFKITIDDTNRVVVSRPQALGGRYLVLEKGLTVGSRTHLQLLAALPTQQQEALVSRIRLQLATANVEFQAIKLPLTRIDLAVKCPVTNELTEARFIESTIDLQQAWIIAREVIVLTLEHGGVALPSNPPLVVEALPAVLDPKSQA